jgi:hypothetical protein
VLPGQRVRFLASDGPLDPDIASKLEAAGVRTRALTRSYLEATLSEDRREDLERALVIPTRINTDTNPVLYHYAMRHWLSQFAPRLGGWGWALALLAGVWILRLRGRRITLFASGFTASAIEFVLLLGYQSLRGSLYREVSLLVAVFMAGLAVGARLAARSGRADNRGWLPRASLGLAIFCLALPGLFALVRGMEGWSWMPGFGLGTLMLVLAILTGMQLPLAGAAERGLAATVGARLYSADLVGAAAGAFLASTVLVPQLGFEATCWGTAGLNLVGALAAGWRRSTA